MRREADIALARRLALLFEAHGVAVTIDEEWVLNVAGMFVRARTAPGDHTRPGVVRADFEIAHTSLGDRLIREAFVGIGESPDDALDNALQYFAMSDLHLLLFTLCGPPKAEGEIDQQVNLELWPEFPATSRTPEQWKVVAGNVVPRGKMPGYFPYPPFYEKLQNLVLTTELSPETHWIRTFMAQHQERILAREVLLDNETWPEGERLLEEHDWPVMDGYFSFRHFLMLKPTAET